MIARNATDVGRVLGRLKPDPVPAIHPVPEHAARGALAEVYARTRQGLGVPWMGVVAMALAHYPCFYDRLWSALAPLPATQAFATACDTLRSAADSEAAALAPPDRVRLTCTRPVPTYAKAAAFTPVRPSPNAPSRPSTPVGTGERGCATDWSSGIHRSLPPNFALPLISISEP